MDETVDTQPNELGESFRRALYRRTRGHPLFTIELLRALRERGKLERGREGRWRVAADIEWAELPAQIAGVLEERLGRLPPESRRLLDVAAVEGETFTAQVVAGALDLPERDVVRELSGPLRREHRLLQSLGTQRLGPKRLSRFRFRHALFRKFLYDALDESRRSYLHEDVGRALEEVYDGQTETVVGQLARHFSEAGLDEEGLRYALQAGDRARLAYAHEEAAGHYENALVFLRERKDHDRVARTLMKLGLTYQLALEHGHARRVFEEGFVAWRRAESKAPYGQQSPAPHPFREPYDYEPQTLDPTRGRSLLDRALRRQLFSSLIENPDGTGLVPDVAERWEIDDGGRIVIYHLRQDARWSDSHLLTAEDFVLSWRRSLAPRQTGFVSTYATFNIKGARGYAQGKASADALGIRAPDPHTLVIELERPSRQFLNLVHYPVPAHVVRRHGEKWAAPEHLVSNGPFRLVRWRPRREMVFERNPYYHGHYPGNVDRIVYSYVKDWPMAMELYENDELDVLHLLAFSGSVQAFDRARRRLVADYVSAPWLQTTVLYFDVERAPFHDPRVRRALALAVDRHHLADVHVHGLFLPADGGIIPPGVAGHTPHINVAYAPQRARDLLAQAGYPGGRNFPDVVAYGPGKGPFGAIRAALREEWRNVLGLDIQLQPVEWGERKDDTPHLAYAGKILSYDTPPAYFLRSFAQGQRFYGRKKALDDLLDRARETLEVQARLQLCQHAERLFVKEALAFPLLYGRAHYFLKSWVRGYLPHGMGIRWKDLVIEPH